MNRKRVSEAVSGIRMEYIAECESYSPPDRKLSSEKEQPMQQIKQAHKHFTGKIIALILAACLVMGLGITAYATGAISSLIAKWSNSFILETPTDELRKEDPEYAQWLDAQLETRAMMEQIGENSIKEERTLPLVGIDGSSVTLLESYYDGEKITMACKLSLPELATDFDFDEEHPMFPKLEQLETGYQDLWQQDVTSAEDRQRIEQELREKGKVGFTLCQVFLRDHVYLNGEDLGPCHSEPDADGIFIVQPYVTGIGDVVLPEKCRNQPSVEVEFTVRKIQVYHWLEEDKVMHCVGEPLDVPVRFTLENINQSGATP